jgi:hypothetical protein
MVAIVVEKQIKSLISEFQIKPKANRKDRKEGAEFAKINHDIFLSVFASA